MTKDKKLIYGIDDKPPFFTSLALGAQHVLTLFGATTLVPLLLGPMIFGADNTAAISGFVSNIYLGMGIATIIQLFLGSRLPIVQGSSFAFITPIGAIAAIVLANGGDPNSVMQVLAGALIAGGIIEVFIGYSGLVGKLKKIITPIVIGPTIMLIGFSLFDVAVSSNAAKYWPVSLAVVAGIFIFSLIVKNRIRLFPVLFSVVIVYMLCLVLSKLGIFSSGHPAYVDLTKIRSSVWFHIPGIFPYGLPVFRVSAILTILAAYFASIIESIGDYHSVSFAAGAGDPSAKTISRGIGAEGLGCIINGILGASGATSYTENIGLISISKVASRYVVLFGAAILIVLSFFSKLGAVVATMPAPIIGGAYIALFGVIGALGIQILTRADMTSHRNIMIVGFSFLMGLGIGRWMPGFYLANPNCFGAGCIAVLCWDIIAAVFSTPMAVGGLSALILDNLLPGTPEERGILNQS